MFFKKSRIIFTTWALLLILLQACDNTSPNSTPNSSIPNSNPTTNFPQTVNPTSNTSASTKRTPVLVKDFIGVNQSYKLYQDHTEKDFARVSKWLRDYVKWYCLQPGENNFNGFEGKAGCGEPNYFNYNAFYRNMQAAGVKILQASEHSPAFANSQGKDGDFVPLKQNANGQSPNDFLAHAQFLNRVVNYFGGDKNLIQAIENWNEPDGWWKGKGLFSKEQFYNMSVADYNGDNNRLPQAGVKQANNPQTKFVLAGLASSDLSYWYEMLARSNRDGRKFPADVLNLHFYGTDGKTGLAPEQSSMEELMRQAVRWRDNYAPDSEIWLTEFGWDTFSRGNEHSRSYAGEQNQANWLLRSLVLLQAAGLDKAFTFIYQDTKSDSTETYNSSGLVRDNNQKKPAYYYLGTMQDILGETYLDSAVNTGREDVRAYLFRQPNVTKAVYTIWKSSSDGSKLDNFELLLPANSQNCSALVPNTTSFEPSRTPLILTAEGRVRLSISETVTFVACEKVGETIAIPAPKLAAPAIESNGRIALGSAQLFHSGPIAIDPTKAAYLSSLTDEPKSDPDNPTATPPKTSWSPVSSEDSFTFDLAQGYDLTRLAWFDAGGPGSLEVFYAAPGAYGNWQSLATITNSPNSSGKWQSLSLNSGKIQYLKFVPKATGSLGKLGEIALYGKKAETR